MTPDYDSPWKDLLDRFFEEYVEFFFPAAHAQIDWAAGFEFLDKELQKITAEAAIGRRAVDKLVKVRLKAGPNVVAMIHNEIQGEREPDFEERIYVYHFRITDRFNERVATFVLLTDDNRRWRPSRFGYELLGTKVSLVFSIAKVLDYRGKWDELERNPSVFAVVVMALLRMIETRRNPRRRLEWKLTLTKMLYERGYDERTIIDLFRFLDWLMFLPEGLQQSYRGEVERYTEEKKMPYMWTIEGQTQLKERLETTTELLQQKFGALDEKVKSSLHELTYEQLKQLTGLLLKLDTLDQLRDWLRQMREPQPQA